MGTLPCAKCFLIGGCEAALFNEALPMYKASFFVVLFLGIAHSAQAALPEAGGSSGWSVFSDPRYGTQVGYPSWFSVSAGRPQLGTGQRLVTRDGRAEIEIYSLQNTAHYTPRSYLAAKMKIDPATLHYRRITARFFALSAAREGKIYYTRCNFSGGGGGMIHCVYLGYPQSEKREWDSIVTHVSYSLRP
jgi:hypothetical protein